MLSNDGADVGAAWTTIEAIGDHEALDQAVDDAFPGARVSIDQQGGRFALQMHQPGLLRPPARRVVRRHLALPAVDCRAADAAPPQLWC